MNKIIKFLNTKVTCEVWLIISLVLIILGSVLPFQTVINGETFTFIQSRFKVVCIIAILIVMIGLALALLKKKKILKWYLFIAAFFVVVSLFLLFVESMRNHYAQGKTKYEIGTWLYSVGTIIMVILGMYSLAGTINIFEKQEK